MGRHLTRSDLDNICQRWAAAWSQPDPDPAVWLALYASTGSYTDHAFCVKRTGHEGLADHFNIWRTCMPDFVLKITESWPPQMLDDESYKCSIRTWNTWTFIKDLPSKKATGKEWVFPAVIDLVVGANGLILEIDEYHLRDFEKGEKVEDYRTGGKAKA